MTPTKAKLKAMRDWAMPKDVKNVQPSLTFANYNQQFIKNFAVVAELVELLTKKGVAWKWIQYQYQDFQSLKDILCSTLVSLFPNRKLLYTVVMDGSITVIGEILM